MALVDQQVVALLERLSLLKVEQLSALPLCIWQTLNAHIQIAEMLDSNKVLRPAEIYLKYRALTGEPGYSNQNFLAAGHCLVQAATAPLALFLDILQRAAGVFFSDALFYVMIDVLYQKDGSKLSWLLAHQHFIHHIVLYYALGAKIMARAVPWANARRLLAYYRHSAPQKTIVHARFIAFLAGHFAGVGIRLGGEIFDIEAFVIGYVTNAGRDYHYLQERFPTSIDLINSIVATYNLRPFHGQVISETLALEFLYTHVLVTYSQTGQRPFPLTDVHIPLLPWETLQDRARICQELLPRIYAPSPALTNWLEILRFMASGGTAHDTGTLDKIALIFSRTDLLPVEQRLDKLAVFYEEGYGCLTKNPLYDTIILRSAKLSARAYIALKAATLYVQRRHGNLLQLGRTGMNFDPLSIETLRQLSGPVAVTILNSYTLQTLYPECESVEVLENKSLIFHFHGAKFIYQIRNAYDAETWQQLGVAVTPTTAQLTASHELFRAVATYAFS